MDQTVLIHLGYARSPTKYVVTNSEKVCIDFDRSRVSIVLELIYIYVQK